MYGYDLGFLDKNTPLRSRFLGLFVTDGHMNRRNEVVIGSIDKEMIYQIKNGVKYTNKVRVINKGKPRQTFYRLDFATPIGKKMQSFGFAPGVKTGKEFIPDCITKSSFSKFLQGVIEGDGSFRLTNKIYLTCSIASASKKFLNDILQRLRLIKVVRGGSIGPGHGIWSLCFSQADAISLGRYIYNGTNRKTRLNRKFDRWSKFKHIKMQRQIQKNTTCNLCAASAYSKDLCKHHYMKQYREHNIKPLNKRV